MSADDSGAEKWDDDFEFDTRPEGSGVPLKRLSVAENWDDDFEDENVEEDEFGFTDKLEDEDQTVTGRASNMGLRLNPLHSPSPVPHPQPFPRSPSSSVFSLPTTIAGDSACYGSTAHLYPRSPLPPFKERDRDRERRRLRKKSRPQPQGVFELIPVHQSHSSGLITLQQVVNGNENRHPPPSPSPSPARKSTQSEAHSRPHTPQTPTSTTSNPSSVPCSSPLVPAPMSPGSPGSTTKGAFLSRITSVKKWGVVRRKRGVSQGQNQSQTDDTDPSRPTSSLSSLPLSVTSSHQMHQTGRHASYGGVVSCKTTGDKSDVFLDNEPTSSPPPLVDKDPAEKPPLQDAGKSLMRGVRRVSLVGGRHRRQKSGTAPALPQLQSQEVKEWLPPEAAPPLNLLPPVEIQAIPPLPPLPPPPPKPIPESSPEIEAITDLQTPRKGMPFSSNNPTTPPSSPKRRGSITKSPTSPQSASLGRSAYSPTQNKSSPEEKSTPRRNSLGDLKIPARISLAQVGLRRDLGMVKEFANSVEQLREMQSIYHGLVVEIQALLDDQAHLHAVQQQAARSVSPSFFSRPVGRKRSNTNPPPLPVPPQHLEYKQLASAFYTINSKYRITWECAELLIELGGGSSSSSGGPVSGPTTSVSAPVMGQGRVGGDELLSSASSSWAKRKGRERAITLAGDESKPPSPLEGITMLEGSSSSAALVSPTSFSSSSGVGAWRASTGRHEINQRQMILLKELLNGADSNLALVDRLRPGGGGIPEEPSSSPTDTSVNREWKWGDPSNSTVTLPPSESSGGGGCGAGTRPPSSIAGIGGDGRKKRRASKLGMAGFRDLLKMLKRHYTAHPVHPMPSFGSIPPSTSSLASVTNSSSDNHQQHSGGGYPSSSSNLGHGERPVTYGRRRAKTSFGPESLASSSTRDMPFLYDDATTPMPMRQRGRPSLAAIFRIPKPLKPSKVSPVQPDSPPDEDWDRVDSPVELDKGTKTQSGTDGMPTVRGKGRSPYLQQGPPSSFGGRGGGARRSPSRSSLNRQSRPTADSSQTSLYEDSPSSSSHNVMHARLSNVDEDGGGNGCGPAQARAPSKPPPPSPSGSSNVGTPLTPPPRASSRYFWGKPKALKNGSVRSMPPQPMPELRLAMTPENIKPLVENAKEVHATLVECIAEIQSLLENYRLAPADGR